MKRQAFQMSSSDFLVVDSSPRLGLGLAALGRPGYICLGRESDLGTPEDRSPEAMRDRAWAVLDAAWAKGVRYFDCARSYGKSEEFLSAWLAARKLLPDQVSVGSKWGYRYTADWQVDTGGVPHEVKDHSLTHLNKQLLESTPLLGEHLRLYQIHSATLESGVLEDQSVLDRLLELKASNGLRLGLSLSGEKQAVVLERALKLGVFDCVQATWNLLEQSVGSMLITARKAGLQIIVKEAVANGRVLLRPELTKVAQRLGVDSDALAIAAVMAQPFEPLVLSGAVTVAQLESNFGAVALAERLRNDDRPVLDELVEAMRMSPADYWKERSALTWN